LCGGIFESFIGNETGGVDIFSYQVSNIAVAMTRDEIIEASIDPAVMRVCKSTPTQYVPEVFYKYKNAYNLLVQEAANPTFPVEYLLVNVCESPFFFPWFFE